MGREGRDDRLESRASRSRGGFILTFEGSSSSPPPTPALYPPVGGAGRGLPSRSPQFCRGASGQLQNWRFQTFRVLFCKAR